MTDWTKRLRRASFGGQGFYVETGSIEAGHRVSTTGIPNGLHINESFGPAARKFEVEAYLTGDLCLVRAAALLAMAENSHRGVLVLPDSGPAFVRVTKATREFRKDKLGFVVVSIEAVAEPELFGQSLSANALENQVYALAGGASAALGGFAGATFTLAGQPSPVLDQAVTAAAGALGDMAALREASRLSPASLAVVAPAFAAAETALAGFVDDPGGFGAALAAAAVALGDSADPGILAQTIVSLGPPADPLPAQVSRGTALVIAANATEAVALTASARALALGEGMARRGYADRPAALMARAVAAAVFDDALARIGRAGLDLARELSAMKGVLAELVTRREADLAPIIHVSVPARMPSLWWAWRLYADPTRGEDLAKRAGAFNPASLPESFDALAV